MPTLLLMSDTDLRFGADLFAGVEGAADFALRCWPDVGAREDIDYLLIWGAPQATLSEFPNLKGVFSLGAGIDHLGDLGAFPAGLPLVRYTHRQLTDEMASYVVLNVLRFHRLDLTYRAQQREARWLQHDVPPASSVRVGVAGAGVLGQGAAKALLSLGYDVALWSRTPKPLEGAESFVGAKALPEFLGRSDILVSLLPLTEETRGLWNEERFSLLPKGASFINGGRGGLVVEADLLAALERGQVSAAALDVFEHEPLPPDHPFWSHPHVVVTPHVASLTHPGAFAAHVVAGVAALERGEEPAGLVHTGRGY